MASDLDSLVFCLVRLPPATAPNSRACALLTGRLFLATYFFRLRVEAFFRFVGLPVRLCIERPAFFLPALARLPGCLATLALLLALTLALRLGRLEASSVGLGQRLGPSAPVRGDLAPVVIED